MEGLNYYSKIRKRPLDINTKVVRVKHIEVAHYSRIFVMVSVEPEKLGDFVKRVRKAKKLSYKEVAERSRGRISAAYVGKIETDPSVQPSVPKLQGLAFGLGEPEEAVINIVRGEKPAPAEFDERLAIAASGYEKLDRRGKGPLHSGCFLSCRRN